jgi:predicted Rossmann fold flavoprotein
MNTPPKKLLVIGGGAAGFFCAVNAAAMNPNLEVMLVEKTTKLLSKVKVSGGGRCNVTHACFSIPEMVKKYPRGGNFLKKTFHHFFTTDTIAWFTHKGVPLITEADGRMFPATHSSESIINCLLNACNALRVSISTNSTVTALTRAANKWVVAFSNGTAIEADFVCVACGGYPKAVMFDWLTLLGHTLQPPVPSLFSFNMPANPITQLMGLSLSHAQVKIAGTKLSEQGPLLITHWGMSGPAVLKLSAWGARVLAEKAYSTTALLNWLPAYNETSLQPILQQHRLDKAAQLIYTKNPFALPQRLWNYLLDQSGITENISWANLPSSQQQKLIKNLCAGAYAVSGKTTFKEEFVTAGGITLSEIDPHTMCSKIQPNLYFAGEIMDVDGITGGFNFQHAWTSGFIAAKAISQQGY